jgi:hypothetical protein
VVNDHDDDHDFWLVNGGTTTPRARTTAGSAHFDNLHWWRGNTRLHYWYFCDRRWIYAWIWHYWRHAGAHDRNLLRWYMNNNWLRGFRKGTGWCLLDDHRRGASSVPKRRCMTGSNIGDNRGHGWTYYERFWGSPSRVPRRSLRVVLVLSLAHELVEVVHRQ